MEIGRGERPGWARAVHTSERRAVGYGGGIERSGGQGGGTILSGNHAILTLRALYCCHAEL
jgi:hypothetical protein